MVAPPIAMDPAQPKDEAPVAQEKPIESPPPLGEGFVQHEGEVWATFEALILQRHPPDPGGFRSWLKWNPQIVRRITLPAKRGFKMYFSLKDVDTEFGPIS